MIPAIAAAVLAATTTLAPVTADTPAPRAKVCKDRLVGWIKAAGFTGTHVRVAWAVAQRESNGTPTESTWPDLGLYQLNGPAWQGSKYWPADVYDPIQNTRAVRRMVRDMGWQPWGLRVSGGRVSYDFSSYGGWSSWQHHNWIVAPFERYWRQFPKACR
jgi:hypothetical protein